MPSLRTVIVGVVVVAGAAGAGLTITSGGGGSGCPAWPSLPDSSCTGYAHTGVSLTTYTGPTTITTNGTTIDSKDIGCLTIEAANVTITRSRITCQTGSPTTGGGFAVTMVPGLGGTNLTITDTEITRPAGGTGGLDYAVEMNGATGLTMTRVDMHNLTSGVHMSGATTVTIQDSFIHGLVNISGSDHNDDLIANGSSSHVNILHDDLQDPLGQTAAIATYPEGSPNSFWDVEQTRLNGGGFCWYAGYTPPGESTNHHFTFQNVIFGNMFFTDCGSGGDIRDDPSPISDSGTVTWVNVVDGTGASIPAP